MFALLSKHAVQNCSFVNIRTDNEEDYETYFRVLWWFWVYLSHKTNNYRNIEAVHGIIKYVFTWNLNISYFIEYLMLHAQYRESKIDI